MYQGAMFQIPYLQLDCKDASTKKIHILEYERAVKQVSATTVITNYNTQEENSTLVELVEKIFYEELQLFNKKFSLKASKILSAWLEIAMTKMYHGLHNHGTCGFSAVYYYSYNNLQHTPTIFKSPFLNFVDSKYMEYIPRGVKEGTLLFFPSSIVHYTLPNESEEERKILSFNLKVAI